jgi:hypothetical protein
VKSTLLASICQEELVSIDGNDPQRSGILFDHASAHTQEPSKARHLSALRPQLDTIWSPLAAAVRQSDLSLAVLADAESAGLDPTAAP